MGYIEDVYTLVKKRNPGEPEFHQAVSEVLESLRPVIQKHPEYQEVSLLERLVAPERVIMFRVPWMEDNGFLISWARPAESSPRVESRSAFRICSSA